MEEDESKEKITELEEKKKADLKYKRSFFVRMVSDPKIYNPKIVKAQHPAVKGAPHGRRDSHGQGHGHSGGHSGGPNVNQATSPNPSPIASWISWPLAFMLQEVVDEVSSEVPFRFRNWESTLTIKPGGGASGKTSPENESGSGGHHRSVSPNPFGRRSRSPSTHGQQSQQQPSLSPKKTRGPAAALLEPPQNNGNGNGGGKH